MRRAPYKSPTQIGCLFSSGRMTLCNNNHPLEQFSLWHSMEYYAVMGFVHEFMYAVVRMCVVWIGRKNFILFLSGDGDRIDRISLCV